MNSSRNKTVVFAVVVFVVFLVAALAYGINAMRQNAATQDTTNQILNSASSNQQTNAEATSYTNNQTNTAPAETNASNNEEKSQASPEKVTYTSNVEELLQNPTLPGGCEVTALACNLRALGFDADLKDLADNYLVYSEDGSYDTGYSGSPYDVGFGFPACMVATANAYLADQGAEGAKFEAIELTDVPFSTLLDYVNDGWPVVVWTTMYCQSVQHSGTFSGPYEWYYNEHCVVLFEQTDAGVRVSDPMDGIILRSETQFADIYEDCGMHALIIKSKA